MEKELIKSKKFILIFFFTILIFFFYFSSTQIFFIYHQKIFFDKSPNIYLHLIFAILLIINLAFNYKKIFSYIKDLLEFKKKFNLFLLAPIFFFFNYIFNEHFLVALSWLSIFAFAILINSIDIDILKKTLTIQLNVIFVLIILGLIGTFILKIFSDHSNLKTLYACGNRFISCNKSLFLSLFFNGEPYHKHLFLSARTYFFTSQSSVIPIMILIPFLIVSLYKKISYLDYAAFIIILLLSYSGSVSFILIMAIIYLIFFNYRNITIHLIFLSSILTIILSIFFVDYVENYLIRFDLISPFQNYLDEINLSFLRYSSGIERYQIIGLQLAHLIENPFGAFIRSNIANTKELGSLILTYGIRGGIILSFITIFFYYSLLSKITNYEINNKKEIISLSLLLASIVLFFVFQDMGASRHLGFIYLIIINRILEEKKI